MRWALGALGAWLALSFTAWLRTEYKQAEVEAGRKSGRLAPRWTDANRWEKR
jgi:hypothetical protein